MTELNFPKDFVWGVATSSYQIEGAWQEGGKSESIWDRFTHTPGRIADGSNGDVAIDHYHRWPEDVALMARLGIQAYRFSIAWPRILPDGRGRICEDGLDFYSRLVDGLLESGITPYATLYHWDLPQVLQDQGGWPARAIVDAFVEYTDVVTRVLGDRVKTWFTHNEPWCIANLSYEIGEHAPGKVGDLPAALRAAHHVLVSYGKAMPVIRTNSAGSKVGIVLNLSTVDPASRSWADLNAARLIDGWFNRWYLDPIFGRRYPADMVAQYMADGRLPQGLDFVEEGDYELMAAPMDVLGINYYTRQVARAQHATDNAPQTVFVGSDATEMGWEVYPDGLYQLLSRLRNEYHAPEIVIAENGASYSDGPDGDGKIHDTRRIDYLRSHLAAAHQAIRDGVPLAGYFSWSLMDNFEWAKGYAQRFGMVWVDYETLERTPKDSALWYSEAIKRNGFEI